VFGFLLSQSLKKVNVSFEEPCISGCKPTCFSVTPASFGWFESEFFAVKFSHSRQSEKYVACDDSFLKMYSKNTNNPRDRANRDDVTRVGISTAYTVRQG